MNHRITSFDTEQLALCKNILKCSAFLMRPLVNAYTPLTQFAELIKYIPTDRK